MPRLDIPGKDLRDGSRSSRTHKLPGMLHARVDASGGRRRNARSAGTTPPAGRSPAMCARFARAISSPWSRPTNGQPSGHRRRSSRPGPPGRACPTRPSCSTTCAARRSTATKCCRTPAMPTEARKAGGRTLQATYDLAMNTHGSIGPSCAVADFKDGVLTVWTAVAGEPPAASATGHHAASCRRSACAASTSRARAAMAATAPTTAPPKRR